MKANKLSMRNNPLVLVVVVSLVTVLLLIWRFTLSGDFNALEKQASELQLKIPKLMLLHKQSGLSKDGLNLSDAAIQEAFNQAVGRFGAQGLSLHYNEQQDRWLLNIQNVSGHALLRVMDALSQRALLVDSMSLRSIQGQPGKVGGSAILMIPSVTP